MWSFMAPAFRLTLVLTVLTGLVYPAVVTRLAQAFFAANAHGSLVSAGGKVVGSTLIGQSFSKPEYLHPRPSAAGQNGYDASASLASNYGATNGKLIDRVKASAEQYRQENPGYNGPIPADALTTSASGLDPHISPANAEIQAARVARARNVDVGRVRELILRATERPWLGFIGEPRVNVLLVNLTLDDQLPRR
jgi:K+-transporting ATPase ATPase C chain